MKLAPAALAVSLAATPAIAQHVGGCDGLDRASAIVEPWEAHSRSFSDGAVRLALLDVIEPGAVPFHLLLLSPPYDELGGRMCRVISRDPGIGFHSIDWAALEARYDPAVGLIFRLPVETWTGAVDPVGRDLRVTLNQATGAVEAMLFDDAGAEQ